MIFRGTWQRSYILFQFAFLHVCVITLLIAILAHKNYKKHEAIIDMSNQIVQHKIIFVLLVLFCAY